jgi:hypothetical protein
MTTIVEQLKAAQVLGFDFILFEDNEPKGLYHTGEKAMEAMQELDEEGAEDGSLEIVFVNTGDIYSTNGLPDDIGED